VLRAIARVKAKETILRESQGEGGPEERRTRARREYRKKHNRVIDARTQSSFKGEKNPTRNQHKNAREMDSPNYAVATGGGGEIKKKKRKT